MTRYQRWSIRCGMALAVLGFGLSVGTRWSGAAFMGALWLWILGGALLTWGSPEDATKGG